MKGIQINKLKEITDSKGIVIEWCKDLPGKQVTIYHRKAGITFGEHFHKGEDPSKNPERFFLIKGKLKLSATNKNQEKFEEIIEENTEIIISPYVFHKMEAITDVSFIEYRSTVFNPQMSDTFVS
jgi:hypothetical protein